MNSTLVVPAPVYTNGKYGLSSALLLEVDLGMHLVVECTTGDVYEREMWNKPVVRVVPSCKRFVLSPLHAYFEYLRINRDRWYK